MSFFNQDGGDKNLQYDNTAFFYFIATLLIAFLLWTIYIIIDRLKLLRIKDQKKLSTNFNSLFGEKIQYEKKRKFKKVFNTSLVWLLIFAIFCILGILAIREQVQGEVAQMKGFDPFSILDVTSDATLRQIRKSYRGLSLKYHPDRNKTTEAKAVWSIISKAYDCFKSDQKKANCFKFGNPDGDVALKVGIGLPNFFISNEYQFYVLPIVLAILLVIIPSIIIRKSNKLKAVDSYGISLTNYETIFELTNSQFSSVSVFYLIAKMTQLTEDQEYGQISTENHNKLNEILKQMPKFNLPIYETLNSYELNVLWLLVNYAANEGEFPSQDMKEKIEDYMQKIMRFFVPFAMKKKTDNLLYNNPAWEIQYLPFIIFKVIEFQRIFYNRKLKIIPNLSPWSYSIDFNNEQKGFLAQRPLKKSLFEIIGKKEEIDLMVQPFAKDRQENLIKQIGDFPMNIVEVKFKIAGKEVESITENDYVEIWFKVEKKKNTSGYCALSNYQGLKKEKVYFVFGIEQNILHFREIEFDYNENYYIGKFQERFMGIEGTYNFFGAIMSDCFEELDFKRFIKVKISKTDQQWENKKIVFHNDDLHLERMKKNFFEQVISLEIEDPEEKELSDDEEEEEKPLKKHTHDHDSDDDEHNLDSEEEQQQDQDQD